jgi:hypothetical protein
MRMYHQRSVWLYNLFPYYLINGTIFENKLNIKSVFWCSLKFLSATFVILRKLSEIWPKIYIGLHVKYPLFLSDFNQIWISSIHFRKEFKYQSSLIFVQWEPSCSMRTDRQTWRNNSRFSQILRKRWNNSCLCRDSKPGPSSLCPSHHTAWGIPAPRGLIKLL